MCFLAFNGAGLQDFLSDPTAVGGAAAALAAMALGIYAAKYGHLVRLTYTLPIRCVISCRLVTIVLVLTLPGPQHLLRVSTLALALERYDATVTAIKNRELVCLYMWLRIVVAALQLTNITSQPPLIRDTSRKSAILHPWAALKGLLSKPADFTLEGIVLNSAVRQRLQNITIATARARQYKFVFVCSQLLTHQVAVSASDAPWSSGHRQDAIRSSSCAAGAVVIILLLEDNIILLTIIIL